MKYPVDPEFTIKNGKKTVAVVTYQGHKSDRNGVLVRFRVVTTEELWGYVLDWVQKHDPYLRTDGKTKFIFGIHVHYRVVDPRPITKSYACRLRSYLKVVGC